MERKVVVLDRDGVINVRRQGDGTPFGDRGNYVLRWEDFEFIPGSKEAIRRLLEQGYAVVTVSNQACVGKGYATKKEINTIHARMWTEIKVPKYSKCFAMMCPHTVKRGCSCRKPKPGMIYAAAFMLEVCLKEAWMVGDSHDDMRAGWAACIRKLILINPEVCLLEPGPKERRVAQPAVSPNLAEAVEYIINEDKKNGVFNDDSKEEDQSP